MCRGRDKAQNPYQTLMAASSAQGKTNHPDHAFPTEYCNQIADSSNQETTNHLKQMQDQMAASSAQGKTNHPDHAFPTEYCNQIVDSSGQETTNHLKQMQDQKEQNRKRSRTYYASHKEQIAIRRHLRIKKQNETIPVNGKSINVTNPQAHQKLRVHEQYQTKQIMGLNVNARFITTMKSFRSKIDVLSNLEICNICKESYPGMLSHSSCKTPTCRRCINEKGVHRFSLHNNMDPGDQPIMLKILTQVEEMLIARVNLILQVTHTIGGQYKYNGHTISIPQDIQNIATVLPCKLGDMGDVDVLIVHRPRAQGNYYDCYISRGRVMDALQYKVKYDPYYKDVSINYNNLNQIPEERTDVSSMLHTIEANYDVIITNSEDADEDQDEGTITNTSSFILHLPNEHRELQIIKKTLELEDTTDNIIDWPEIGLTPINEYNTEGLLDMAFPTLFPNGIGLQMQPRTREIKMHEYVLHLMRFHDQRFGQHPRF
ncbi:uncharacterized protein LOC131069166 [Cryptomeria japonica]|uniref:uncharacterized protein LOC131069166 n=1 Tax=Cryptomeria japonica TaxID=3369 RepID=UPI0025AC6EBA|nr:uncharacterized protein LOC131069166 [Cryptomeria japonica]